MKLGVLGHSRGGTMTICHVLRKMGLDVGHETVGRNGSVCWIWGHPDAERPERRTPKRATDLTHLWHVTRDPLASIPSICTDSSRAWAIRMAVIPELAKVVARREVHALAKAAASWAYWHRACRESIESFNGQTWTFRIEDPEWTVAAASILGRPTFKGQIPRNANSARDGWGNPLNWILRMSDTDPEETTHRPTWTELEGLCPTEVFDVVCQEAEVHGYGLGSGVSLDP